MRRSGVEPDIRIRLRCILTVAVCEDDAVRNHGRLGAVHILRLLRHRRGLKRSPRNISAQIPLLSKPIDRRFNEFPPE
jgi:hypothetical protein